MLELPGGEDVSTSEPASIVMLELAEHDAIADVQLERDPTAGAVALAWADGYDDAGLAQMPLALDRLRYLDDDSSVGYVVAQFVRLDDDPVIRGGQRNWHRSGFLVERN
jgi:hypothetical protein